MTNASSEWTPNFARSYLSTYYTQPPTDDEELIQAFLVDQLKRRKPSGAMIELGCGPTIHHVIPFAEYADAIDMADYLPENLNEVRAWARAEANSHDWSEYLDACVAREGRTEQSAREDRSVLLRRKINRFLHLDLLSDPPLAAEGSYGIVGCFYTTEQVGFPKTTWPAVLSRVASVVAPGGHLFMSAVGYSDYYVVHDPSGDRRIPLANLTEQDFRTNLVELGFKSDNLVVEASRTESFTAQGLNGVILVAAQKSA